MNNDEWSQHRSYLNHTELSNSFRWGALTPDRSIYAEAAIKGMQKDQYLDPDEQADFEETKLRIEKWPSLKRKIMDHANKVTFDFNPYSAGFDLLRSYLSDEELTWLNDIVKNDLVVRFKLDQWKLDLADAINRIDNEIANVKKGKSAIEELRIATDILINIFSGRGYFNYAEGN